MVAHDKSWGAPMAKQIGFYEYSMSPYQLKPFKGFFNPGFSNLAKRTGRQLIFIGPPLVFFYFLSGWADEKVFCDWLIFNTSI